MRKLSHIIVIIVIIASANVNYLSIINIIGIIANLSVNYRSLVWRLFPDVH